MDTLPNFWHRADCTCDSCKEFNKAFNEVFKKEDKNDQSIMVPPK